MESIAAHERDSMIKFECTLHICKLQWGRETKGVKREKSNWGNVKYVFVHSFVVHSVEIVIKRVVFFGKKWTFWETLSCALRSLVVTQYTHIYLIAIWCKMGANRVWFSFFLCVSNKHMYLLCKHMWMIVHHKQNQMPVGCHIQNDKYKSHSQMAKQLDCFCAVFFFIA